jgi:mono/diheme cytochrome c family protein
MREAFFSTLFVVACSSPVNTTVGAGLAAKYQCASCHGQDLSGNESPIGGSQAYAGNLTPDPTTGIGGWTDDQIIADLRNDPCTAMPSFALNDAQATEIVAYLRGLPPVVHSIPMSDCAGPAPSDIDDAGVDDAGVLIITNP